MSTEKLQPLDIPALLNQYALRPKKGLGQNFLINESALRQVSDTAGLTGEDTVLEVGPGLGSLTRYLAMGAGRVIAVELDRNMIMPLREIMASFSNTKIIQGDIMALDISSLIGEGAFKVVANIPYYITSNLIRRLLENRIAPERFVLTIQEEVAKRICALPGDLSVLAVSVQVYGKPKIVATLPPEDFYPQPKVNSAILQVDLRPEPVVAAEFLPVFFRLVKAGFSQKRKTLRNALSGGLGWPKEKAVELLESGGVDPQRRAETLEIEEWGTLARLFL